MFQEPPNMFPNLFSTFSKLRVESAMRITCTAQSEAYIDFI